MSVSTCPERAVVADVRTVRGMWLRSERLHLTGRADIVEFRPEPYPVEYKRGKSKPDDCDTVQLCAQALCLEEMLQTAIPTRRHFLWQAPTAAGG